MTLPAQDDRERRKRKARSMLTHPERHEGQISSAPSGVSNFEQIYTVLVGGVRVVFRKSDTRYTYLHETALPLFERCTPVQIKSTFSAGEALYLNPSPVSITYHNVQMRDTGRIVGVHYSCIQRIEDSK